MITNIIKSRWFIASIGIVIGIILLLMAFWAGMYVGQRRADFTRNWGNNYGKIFGQPMGGFFQEPGEVPEPRGFGNGGIVLKVSGDTIVIKGNDNIEKTVITDTSTSIQEQRSTISIDQIKTGDMVVIIGEPNNAGQIQAKFIRVFPPMQRLNNSTSTNSTTTNQ